MQGKGKGKTSNKGKGKGIVGYTCGKPGHTSRERNLNKVNAVDGSSWKETSWHDEWNEDRKPRWERWVFARYIFFTCFSTLFFHC